MSVINDITDRVVVQLKNIDGGASYNNNVSDDHVIKGFELAADAIAYPSIYIASASEGASRQTDQVTYEIPITVEMFAYVKSEGAAFEEAMKLVADMETAVYDDETLNSLVWGLSMRFEVATFQALGAVVCVLEAFTQFVKS